METKGSEHCFFPIMKNAMKYNNLYFSLAKLKKMY